MNWIRLHLNLKLSDWNWAVERKKDHKNCCAKVKHLHAIFSEDVFLLSSIFPCSFFPWKSIVIHKKKKISPKSWLLPGSIKIRTQEYIFDYRLWHRKTIRIDFRENCPQDTHWELGSSQWERNVLVHSSNSNQIRQFLMIFKHVRQPWRKSNSSYFIITFCCIRLHLLAPIEAYRFTVDN